MTNHELFLYLCRRAKQQLNFFDSLFALGDKSDAEREYRCAFLDVDNFINAARVVSDHC